MDDSMTLDFASTTSNNGEEEDMIEDTRRGPDSRFPPGFHFNPYDHELILYYLRRKIANLPLLYDVFNDVKLYEYHPKQLVEKHAVWGDNRWYFFTPRDRKYPNGRCPNRKAVGGYWKATGVEKGILCNGKQIGARRALVFYTGKAGKGQKTDWVMYEYINQDPSRLPRKPDGTMKLDDWVLCTIQKKRGADEAKSDQPMNKRNQPSEAEQAGTNQSTKRPKIRHNQSTKRPKIRHVKQIQRYGREVDPLNYEVQQIQQDGREPLNYQVVQQIQQDDREVEQQIQQDGREVEPPLNYQVVQQIQQDGREVEPPLNYQVVRQIQQDGREVEPLYQVVHHVECYDSNANYNNYSATQAPNYNNYSVTKAPAILSDDFMGFMGPTDIGDYSPVYQNFQQNFPNPCTESNGLDCQLDQPLDLEFESQQMVCGPLYSFPTVEESQFQDDTMVAELNSFFYGQEIGIGLDNEDDIAQVFPSQDGIVCQPSQDNHSNVNFINSSDYGIVCQPSQDNYSNVNFINNSDYNKDGEGFKFKQN